MSMKKFALRSLSLIAGLGLVVASTAGASATDPTVPPPAPGGAVFLGTDMNGVNGPAADPDGTGRVVVRIQGVQVCFLVQWNRILAPTTAHIHEAPVGSNGPVTVGFWRGELPASVRGVTGCVTSTAETLAAIVANPAAYYVNVHDATYPAGAIKGQLEVLDRGVDFNSVLRLPLTAQLDGMQELPGAGDPDGRAVGFVRLRAKETVHYAFNWSAIAPPTAAHVHVGSVGQIGGAVVPLFAAPTGLPATLTGVNGEVRVESAVYKAINRRPWEYYLNLHNAEFPAGAVRGQLARASR
ncbi:MAG TPA: CHRD domain-containing protein [Micromonosporaceae bacterium]|nr:CHRD domain-containing protein [Micromonosporaceae bacterium]